MCHISELADGFVDKVENICKVGDNIKVKVINVDDTGRIKLSVKALLKDAEKKAEKETVEN
jgi:polyribonucleotide nucleotidyltransferase